jgi:hypothetical protein
MPQQISGTPLALALRQLPAEGVEADRRAEIAEQITSGSLTGIGPTTSTDGQADPIVHR